MVSEDIVGVAEIAKLLNVKPRTAARYAERPDFPTPIRLARMRVWNTSEVRAWGEEHLPLPRPGRPKKRPDR
jgi:predicted DNA-binding transcriptional regulator AlpA